MATNGSDGNPVFPALMEQQQEWEAAWQQERARLLELLGEAKHVCEKLLPHAPHLKEWADKRLQPIREVLDG